MERSSKSTLRDAAISPDWCHVCVDMQRLFAPGTEWGLPWMPRVIPNVVHICAAQPARTLFTRFIPARRSGDGLGTWKHYYERWASMTLENLGDEQVGLVPELAPFCPPAQLLDKSVYSPWLGSNLRQCLSDMHCDTLLISGGETDMCVLSTALGAMDYGFRTIVVADAVCSVSDQSHDAMLTLFSDRYGQHIETAATAEVLNLLKR